MEGSSLRMMVGMYSALGTLEEMSWGHRERLREGSPPGSPGQWEPPWVSPPEAAAATMRPPQAVPRRHPLTPPATAVAASLPGRQHAPGKRIPPLTGQRRWQAVLTMTLGGRKPSASQATASRPFSASQSRSSKASLKVQCELCRSPPEGQARHRGCRPPAHLPEVPSEGWWAELAGHALEGPPGQRGNRGLREWSQ